MIRRHILMIGLSLFCATAFAGDWLEGGYVGSPDYGEIRQYFTDPIFYSSLPVSKSIGMYSTYGASPSSKPILGLGKSSSKYSLNYLQSPSQSRYSFSAWPSYSSGYPTYAPPYQTPTTPILGNTPLNIKYPDSRKFDVYVDGVYIGSGLGGTFTTSVQGGVNHDIRVWDGLWNYQKSVHFEPGIQKVIYIEAV
jgi:hypothetical protein